MDDDGGDAGRDDGPVPRPGPRRRRHAVALAAAAAAAALVAVASSGCTALPYLAQAVGGHLDLMRRAQPVADLIADPATPPALRERLRLTQRLRDFAVDELKLPDNASYRRYADLQRPAALWNVVAAPPLSLTLRTWCYPLVGCVGYRGLYRRDAADAAAAALRAQGLEVHVYAVPAYSTLGWSEWFGGDPLLNTFVGWPEVDLARMVFHELAHQVAFAGDTGFDEAFATAVERLGSARWLRQRADPALSAQQARADARRAEFRAFARGWREALAGVYAGPGDDAERLRAKADVMARQRAAYAALKAGAWDGFAGYDAFVADANNASLSIQGAYHDLVPDFERLFEREGGDFARFYAAVQRLAALPPGERRATLGALP